MVLSLIQKLYGVESRIKDKSTDEKYIARQEASLPIIGKLKIWLEQNQPQLVGNSKLIEAANYLANQWHKLIRYVDDGRLSIDNNRAERAVKPFVIGRKNWLFSQTANGAHASATLYSIVETVKANDLSCMNISPSACKVWHAIQVRLIHYCRGISNKDKLLGVFG